MTDDRDLTPTEAVEPDAERYPGVRVPPNVEVSPGNEGIPFPHLRLGELKSLTYLDYLTKIAEEDVRGLHRAQESYGDSWKRRGGVGAYMMLARKWDRLENAMTAPMDRAVTPATDLPCDRYDVFERAAADARSEGIIDDIRDLRRYLLLVEAELRSRGHHQGSHRDNR